MSWVGDVYVGAETGLVKSVQLHNQNWINLGGKPSEAKRENEILRICWADQAEKEILMGLRSGDVFKVDMHSQSCVRLLSGTDLHFDSETKYVGLESQGQSQGAIIAGVQKGMWALFKPDAEGIWTPSFVSSMSLKKHQDCRRLRLNASSSHGLVVATGGLNEHLKLWDVNAAAASSAEGGKDALAAKPIFAAKNVKNDWLNLQVRTCIQDIRFIPDSDQIVTCTGYHQVRVYDPKSQRRPVVDFESGEFPLTCMDLVSGNRNHVIVGNTRGVMSQHDLRMAGRLVHGFKGFAGGLRDIRCHTSEPLVASVGLDRYLRVHNVVNHRIVNKIYLKSRLNQCLFKTTLNEGLEIEGEEENGEKKEVEDFGKEDEEEGKKEEEDDVWGGMAVVGDGKKDNPAKEELKSAEEETNNKKRKATVTIVEDGEQMQRKRIKS